MNLSDQIERYAKALAIPEQLHAEMIGLAESLCNQPIAASDAWRMTGEQLTPVLCRAICELAAAGRVNYYSLDDDPGCIYVEAGEGLAEWWVEEVAQTDNLSSAGKPKQRKGNGGASSTPGKTPSTKRGRKVEKETIRRADFAKPLREKGETWPNIYTAFTKKYPRDTDTNEGILRRAFERQYPEIAAKLKEDKATE